MVQEVEKESVQPEIDKQVEELRKGIVSDTVDAVVQTNHALIALEKDRPAKAIAAIKTVIGKLETALKREPG